MTGVIGQLTQALRGAFQWWVVLAPWEQALRVRRGKSVAFLRAGIHLRIPLLDRFFVQSTRFRMTDMTLQTVTTADGKTITLKGQLGYRIIDIGKLYDTLHDAEATLSNITQMEVADYIAGSAVADCDPRTLARVVNEKMRGAMAEYGLGDVRVSITDYAVVKAYRLITQDIWSNTGVALDTASDHVKQAQNGA